jgi:outer membrane protein OmpA-like peptidoglycan-associated protein
MLPKFLVAVPIAVLAIGGSTACATKKFVRTNVGEVNEKVDSLGRSVEETQERTRKNEGRIAEVDQKAQAAAQSAQQANDAASAANTAAATANSNADRGRRQTRRDGQGQQASGLRSGPERGSGQFQVRQTTCRMKPKARLDEMVAQLKQDPKAIYLEIEGHTDNVGDKNTNEKIGMARADAVKRYLYEQYQDPLHKMNVISYGEDKADCAEQDEAPAVRRTRV